MPLVPCRSLLKCLTTVHTAPLPKAGTASLSLPQCFPVAGAHGAVVQDRLKTVGLKSPGVLWHSPVSGVGGSEWGGLTLMARPQ